MPVLDLRTGLVVAVVIGCVLGALSVFGDPAGITVVNALANAAGPWLVAAFAVGALLAVAGTGVLFGVYALLRLLSGV